MSGRRADLWALGVLLLVSLGATWPVTFGGRAMLPTSLYLRMQPWREHSREFPEYRGASNPLLDPVQQHYPWRLFAHHAVRRGEVPLWNPQMLCGTPFLGNGQSAVFYPETWLHYLMHPLHALGWATALFLFIAGSTMYWFLRTIGLRPTGSLIGAVSFQLNGFFVGWLCFPTMRSVGAWLPLMLVGVEKSARTHRAGWLLLTALGVGMQFLAGHLHASLYVLMVCGVYALARLGALVRIGEPCLARRLGGLTVGALALGTMLAAVQLAPVIEMTRLSSRTAGVSYQALAGNALAPPQLLLGLMPDIFGNSVDQNHWGAELNSWWGRAHRAYSETSWYFGVGPLLLAICGIALVRRRQMWFWLGILVFGLLLAFGTDANRVLYYLVPGYPQLTGIGRAVLMTCIGGSVMAALGTDALLSRVQPARDAARVVAIAALALLLIGAVAGLSVWSFSGQLERALPGIGGYTLLQVGRFVLALVLSWVAVAWAMGSGGRVARAALIAVVILDLAIFMQRFTPEDRVQYALITPAVLDEIDLTDGPARVCSIGPDFLNRMSPNTGMLLGLEEVQGSDSLIWRPYHELLGAISSEEHGLPQVDPSLPALGLLNVRYLLTPLSIEDDRWELVASWETNLYRNKNALPRVFLARSVQVHRAEAEVLAAVTAPDADPGVLHLPGTAGGSEDPRSNDPSGVAVKDYEINGLALDCFGVEGDAWLVVSNPNYPGWRAYADGVRVPVVTGDYALQAIYLSGPVREVVLTFLPGSFQVGAFCSLLALGTIVGLAVGCVGRRRS